MLESHSHIRVFALASGPNNAPGNLPPSYFHPLARLCQGQLITATVSGKTRRAGTVDNPFIFVEGFDEALFGAANDLSILLDSTYWKQKILDRINNGVLSHTINRIITKSVGNYNFNWFYNAAINNFDVITDNYDVFYVDLLCPEADITYNALLLKDAIQWINSLKSSNAGRNIIMGHSMGGLIARYALRQMEIDNEPHETDCFVSYDSPHMGVNVPLGLQYTFRDLVTLLNGDQNNDGLLAVDVFDPIISLFQSIYSCPSVKQMLYYFVEPDGTLNTTYHSTWQNQLAAIGFPKGDVGYPIENLSIVNGGSIENLTTELFNLDVYIQNNQVFPTNWLESLLPLLTKTSDLDLHAVAYQNLDDGGIVSSISGVYTKRFSWLSGGKPINLFGTGSRTHSSPYSSIALDDIKSSYITTDNDSNNNSNTFPIYSGTDSLDFHLQDKCLFIPSASALAIDNYAMNFGNHSLPIPHIDTPFDSYWLNTNAIAHDEYKNKYFNWIHNHVNSEMQGPTDFVLTGDYYIFLNPSTGYSTPVWFASDTTVSVTNGVVDVIHPGTMVNIYCESHDGDAYIHKHRRVMAGFPPMNLQYSHLSGNQYTVTATCISTDTELRNKLDELANDSTIKFIWGYKDVSTGNYSWTDTTSTRSFICSVPDGQHRFVALKLHNGPGRESNNPNAIHIDRRSTNPFYFEPTEIWSTQQGAMMYYSDLLGTAASSNQYFAVWYNSGYSPAPPSPNNIQVYLETIPLTDTFQTTIDGELTTVYCFDFADALDLPSPSTPQSFGPLLQAITIRHDTTPLQYVLVPVCW